MLLTLLLWMRPGSAIANTVAAVVKVTGAYVEDLGAAEAIVAGWVADPAVSNTPREAVPISHLKIALQCGGSDAFSGVSGEERSGSVFGQTLRTLPFPS
jgi:altronate dehydratase